MNLCKIINKTLEVMEATQLAIDILQREILKEIMNS